MIKGKDMYEVLAAVVPLYVAMILAYGSVRWWKIFTPDQCSGINRFVAVFAVPFLSFHSISSNDPYNMNYKFIAADSLQKVVILVALFLWNTFTNYGSIDWTIILFSLSTLSNTLVVGVPLLNAMYGEFSASLMVQIVVLQCVIWNTVLLFLFEYRGAKLLISDQFRETAGSITSLKVDSDVRSLNGRRETLQPEAEIGEDGKLHVVVRRSSSVSSSRISFNKSHLTSMTPRASNLTGVEIYSIQSSREPTPRGSSFNQTDSFTNSLQNAGFEEEMLNNMHKKRGCRSMSNIGELSNGGLVSSYQPPKPVFSGSISGGQRKKDSSGGAPSKELHTFVRSSSASSASDVNMRHAVNSATSAVFGTVDPSKAVDVPHGTAASEAVHELINNISSGPKASGERELEIEEGIKYPLSGCQKKEADIEEGDAYKKQQIPPATVMTRLILIVVWRKLIRNPNTYSSLLGLAWSLISFRWNIKMPSIIKGSISILSDTGMGMAMFSLGLFMALQPKIIACGKTSAAISMAVKFLAGPAVMAATSTAIGIRGVLLQVAIVQAALPQAIVPFVFAKEHNLHPDIFSTAIIFGMVVALPVTILYYVLLGI